MRTVAEQLVLKSTDEHCAICLRRKNDPRDSFTMELAHIVPKSHGGQKTFWNLIPTCPKCNPKTRESNKGYLSNHINHDKIEKSHYYWTYVNGRVDVAIKVCLYKLYEYLVLEQDINIDNIRNADILLYHILWNSRTFLYFDAQKLCFELKNIIEIFSNNNVLVKYSTPFEEAIFRHDSGDVELLENIILSDSHSNEIKERSRTVVWRVIPCSNISSRKINALKDTDSFYIPGSSKYYQYEKDFDFRLRIYTSELIKSVCREDKKGINKVMDNLLCEKENIRLGKGCPHTYQRLWPFLAVVCKENNSSEINGILEYVKLHGSKSPVRKIYQPKYLLDNRIIKKYFPIENKKIDIGSMFVPIAGSYASDLQRRQQWINEKYLVAIINKIIIHFKKSTKIK